MKPFKTLSTVIFILFAATVSGGAAWTSGDRPRVIVTTDGEIDDECSMVRFLLYANEWDVEGIITSSSQYHWQGHNWAGDDWMGPYLEAYAAVYPNLVLHDRRYPEPGHLKAVTLLGNVAAEGEMEAVTAGSEHIVKVLLDESDDRPVWLQAWGGTNTIARALKTIEASHPERMEAVAGKMRLFLIWEQDSTYQDYIRPRWGKFKPLTILSDQFWALGYQWKQTMPAGPQRVFDGAWMRPQILEGHGAMCSLYKAQKNGDFRSEGDSPAFLHAIPTGLRSLESPGWGGWGGRYVPVRDNTWYDPVPEPGYRYPEGRWYDQTAWGMRYLRSKNPDWERVLEYYKPIWRWAEAMQNDFAARADWCVKPYAQANHPPAVTLAHGEDLVAGAGAAVTLSAKGSSDPDGDPLSYRWQQDRAAGTFDGMVEIHDADKQDAWFTVPGDAKAGGTIHLLGEVTDGGTPPLTRYRRVIVTVEP